MKKCLKCKIKKPLNKFHKDNSKKDKLCILCKSCRKKESIEYNKKNKEKFIIRDKEYYSKNREKHLAKGVVNNAIKSGKIIKPKTCENCPSTKNIEGHHDDYKKPLEVRWLCKSCHRMLHIKLKSK